MLGRIIGVTSITSHTTDSHVNYLEELASPTFHLSRGPVPRHFSAYGNAILGHSGYLLGLTIRSLFDTDTRANIRMDTPM